MNTSTELLVSECSIPMRNGAHLSDSEPIVTCALLVSLLIWIEMVYKSS